MGCPKCLTGYLLQHPETLQAAKKWLKCTVCGFCCQESDITTTNGYPSYNPGVDNEPTHRPTDTN